MEPEHRKHNEDFCCMKVLELETAIKVLEEQMKTEQEERKARKMTTGQIVMLVITILTVVGGVFGFTLAHLSDNAATDSHVAVLSRSVEVVTADIAELKTRSENLKYIPRMSVAQDSLIAAVRNMIRWR